MNGHSLDWSISHLIVFNCGHSEILHASNDAKSATSGGTVIRSVMLHHLSFVVLFSELPLLIGCEQDSRTFRVNARDGSGSASTSGRSMTTAASMHGVMSGTARCTRRSRMHAGEGRSGSGMTLSSQVAEDRTGATLRLDHPLCFQDRCVPVDD